MNASCHTYECVMSHVWISRVMHISDMPHVGLSHVTHEWVKLHVWISRVTHMNEPCHIYGRVPCTNDSHHTYGRVMSPIRMIHPQIWMSHVTSLNEACDTHWRVKPRLEVSHVTHVNESWLIYDTILYNVFRSWIATYTKLSWTFEHIHMQYQCVL